eukprot:4389437-Amphidinium_carterae.1
MRGFTTYRWAIQHLISECQKQLTEAWHFSFGPRVATPLKDIFALPREPLSANGKGVTNEVIAVVAIVMGRKLDKIILNKAQFPNLWQWVAETRSTGMFGAVQTAFLVGFSDRQQVRPKVRQLDAINL